jgi:hypothetical protein
MHGILSWRAARRCNGDACVEVAVDEEMALIGDSKCPEGPVLSYTRSEWSVFLDGAKTG